MIIDSRGRKKYVVTDKLTTSRALRPTGKRNKTTIKQSKKELLRTLGKLTEGEWSAEMGRHYRWADPSKLDPNDPGYHAPNTKGHVASKIAAVREYTAGATDSAGPAMFSGN